MRNVRVSCNKNYAPNCECFIAHSVRMKIKNLYFYFKSSIVKENLANKKFSDSLYFEH